MTDQETLEKLTRSLVDVINLAIELAKKNGVSPDILREDDYDIVWWEVGGGLGSLRHERRRMQSRCWADGLIVAIIHDERGDAAWTSLSEAARTVVQSASSTPSVVDLADVDNHAQLLYNTYFDTVGALSLDHTVAQKICAQFVHDVTSPEYCVHSFYVVGNLTCPRPFALATNIRFRPISVQDYERFSAVRAGIEPDYEYALSSTDWICEITETGPKTSMEVFLRHRDRIEEVAGALSMTTQGRSSFRLLKHSLESPFFRFGGMSSPRFLYSGATSGAITLDEIGIGRFANNYELLRRVSTDPRFEKMRLPFRRLRSASSREEDEDKLVDYVVGLERLLAPDTENLEVTFRFRLRGGAILPPSFGDAEKRRAFMGKLYDLRSKIVHGSAKPKDISEMLPQAEKAFVEIFKWFGRAVEVVGYDGIASHLDDALVEGAKSWIERVDP